MIKLKQPSLCLHSCDVPGYKYQMHTTWTMPKGATAENVVYWIKYARERSPEMYLHNVVINCHGSPGGLHIGGDANKPGGFFMNKGHTGAFNEIRKTGGVGRIILVACEVAKGSNTDDKLGLDFCQQLAIESGAFVVAANRIQHVNFWFEYVNHPYGAIDEFEGKVYEFSPGGGYSNWKKYDSDND
jgi:hypothetical protein